MSKIFCSVKYNAILLAPFLWRDGRVVEGAPLLREYGAKLHRGFESLSLRHCSAASSGCYFAIALLGDLSINVAANRIPSRTGVLADNRAGHCHRSRIGDSNAMAK